jgi:sorting nexin-25
VGLVQVEDMQLLSGFLPANHEKEDWINGEKTEDVVAFLDRLYTAKRKVEQRIIVLGGEDDSVKLLTARSPKVLIS